MQVSFDADDDDEGVRGRIKEEQLMQPLSEIFNCTLTKFPGALPQNVERSNVRDLFKGYVCALKADGERVFGFLAKDRLVLFRRDKRWIIFKLDHSFETTYIFDGEYMEKLGLFVIFDVIFYRNKASIFRDYLFRVELANHFVNCEVPKEQVSHSLTSYVNDAAVQPLTCTSFKWGVTWHACSKLRVHVKPLYHVESASLVWERRNVLPYSCDGVVFTRTRTWYAPFASDPMSILKWKQHVTVDFLVRAKIENEHLLINQEKVDSQNEFQEFLHPSDQTKHNTRLVTLVDGVQETFSTCVLNDNILQFCDGSVCEFGWNQTSQLWQFQHFREDKVAPNILSTVHSCLRSMRNAIQIEQIATHAFF